MYQVESLPYGSVDGENTDLLMVIPPIAILIWGAENGSELLAMPTVMPPCPKCSAPNTRWLEFTSLTNKTNAFQCVACGYLWQTPGMSSASTSASEPTALKARKLEPDPAGERRANWDEGS